MKLNKLLVSSLFAATAGQQNGSCGAGTYLAFPSGECLCSAPQDGALSSEEPNVIRLAGIFDTTTYGWGSDVFETTVQLINRGFWNVLPPGFTLRYDLANANCDETQAMKGYWKLRGMHGVIGARCSGASMAIARIAGLEGVPQLSPSSNSAALSNDEEFPFFSRLQAPNDERGEVGAMVSMLKDFGWERVGTISTDTQFAKDFVTAFKKSWAGAHKNWFGQIAYSDTVRITPDGNVAEESVLQVLNNIPTDPSTNSRVILLAAHPEHAYPILEIAKRNNFQPDTIWVGPSSWVAKDDNPDQFSWLPEIPGYIGVAPFRNRDEVYADFMTELQSYQRSQGKKTLSELPTFAAEFVDAIRALTMAIVASSDKRNGELIVRKLRELRFQGVSGDVAFNERGDRKNPLYSMFNLQPNTNKEGTNRYSWTDIGVTGTVVGSASLSNGIESVCFAEFGCGLALPPEDTYPLPPYELPRWGIFLILFLVLVFAALVYVTLKYIRSRRSKRTIKAELESFRESVVGLRAAECKYIPRISKFSNDVEQARSLSVQWMWKETECNMSKHTASDVFGDPNDGWVLYTPDCCLKLENAYQKGKKKLSPLPGYTVDLKNLEQTKVATGYKRKVQRVLATAGSDDQDQTKTNIDLTDVVIGGAIPVDLKDEPRMVFCEKDVIKISSQRADGWAFGTKLHHTDEATARKLVAWTLNGAKEESGGVFLDSGWFQLDKTRVPTPDDLAVVQQAVGDSGALDPPGSWEKMSDHSTVHKHQVNAGDKEYREVENAFLHSMPTSNVQVHSIQRIQNLPMWQSYVVKRQTVCTRETGQTARSSQGSVQHKALQRFEKRWLFHGSNYETVDKILQQGFNRSFCGKNATMYGKGVYFARDAKYSAARLYSVPDWKGRQYIMACRVVVGEYCRGKVDALTPDIRDHKSQSLYDSTVDSVDNPSIYVTYHDAQAYPEYLITFTQR